jgi:hypothetical protein
VKITGVLYSALSEEHEAAPACGDTVLQSAVVRLPRYASSYTGRNVERPADVNAAFRRGRSDVGKQRHSQPARQRHRKAPKGRHGGRRSGPVLAQTGCWRLCLSTRRDRFWLQYWQPGADEGWSLVASEQLLSLLWRECLLHDAPGSLLAGLPEEPGEAAPGTPRQGAIGAAQG